MDKILEKILKRANKRSDEICISVDDPDYKRAFVRHYSLGASEQRAIDIEKACDLAWKYLLVSTPLQVAEARLLKFHKALEEEV